MIFSAWTNKLKTVPAAYPKTTSSKPIYWYTTSRGLNTILDNEEAYSIFLQRLDNGQVATKRGSIVLDHLSGKESIGPDELVEHRRAQASVRTCSQVFSQGP